MQNKNQPVEQTQHKTLNKIQQQIQPPPQPEQNKQNEQKGKNEKKQKQPPKVKKPPISDQIWQALILPPNKLKYQNSDLGPQIFSILNTHAKREDFSIRNSRGYKMECSYFEPILISDKPHPVVIYLHGNSSSRLEGLSLLPYLLPIGIAVIIMDFSGCGMSEGQYISLGFYEKDDAQLVIDHIKKTKKISSIGIWGRSMGAATSLMIGTTRNDIDFVVADSSFLCIKQLCQEVAKKQYKLPNFMAKAVWSYIKKKIFKKAGFDINECNTIKYIKDPKHMPNILFVHAQDDTLIKYDHSVALCDAYPGQKNILLIEGTHNSRRPKYVQQEIQKCFQMNLKFHKPNDNNMHAENHSYFQMFMEAPQNLGVFNALHDYQIIQKKQQMGLNIGEKNPFEDGTMAKLQQEQEKLKKTKLNILNDDQTKSKPQFHNQQPQVKKVKDDSIDQCDFIENQSDSDQNNKQKNAEVKENGQKNKNNQNNIMENILKDKKLQQNNGGIHKNNSDSKIEQNDNESKKSIKYLESNESNKNVKSKILDNNIHMNQHVIKLQSQKQSTKFLLPKDGQINKQQNDDNNNKIN
ncbi:hypothetical protein PPERSA_09857 [Pseudocohnilembus persalinus]|uniref:Serine aminopeptidase S33 domain-containing protein n=1 Tax=Pseudocohnilembus persalinus TaxID=266149 RepID=A0A0V0QV28_PSEPJ|nr:hypothetical protein PPERSA_09857 [Pseudocohnilembus persalinus]|eukprot:KRX05717.1 hypothetical protein PPERSA_09857 [Pseudocohnilembus persalinus]